MCLHHNIFRKFLPILGKIVIRLIYSIHSQWKSIGGTKGALAKVRKVQGQPVWVYFVTRSFCFSKTIAKKRGTYEHFSYRLRRNANQVRTSFWWFPNSGDLCPFVLTGQFARLSGPAWWSQPVRAQISGIAISAPGTIDTDQSIIYYGGTLPFLHEFMVRDYFAKTYGLPATALNDGKAAVLAELATGNLQGCQNAAALVLGTGLGVAWC